MSSKSGSYTIAMSCLELPVAANLTPLQLPLDEHKKLFDAFGSGLQFHLRGNSHICQHIEHLDPWAPLCKPIQSPKRYGKNLEENNKQKNVVRYDSLIPPVKEWRVVKDCQETHVESRGHCAYPLHRHYPSARGIDSWEHKSFLQHGEHRSWPCLPTPLSTEALSGLSTSDGSLHCSPIAGAITQGLAFLPCHTGWVRPPQGHEWNKSWSKCSSWSRFATDAGQVLDILI